MSQEKKNEYEPISAEMWITLVGQQSKKDDVKDQETADVLQKEVNQAIKKAASRKELSTTLIFEPDINQNVIDKLIKQNEVNHIFSECMEVFTEIYRCVRDEDWKELAQKKCLVLATDKEQLEKRSMVVKMESMRLKQQYNK